MKKRIPWDDFWITQALMYSTRATCDRMRTACIIVDKNKRLVGAGYNGSIPGEPHCDDAGHRMIGGHCVRTIHSELNALTHAGNRRIEGATAYILDMPCVNCAKVLINAGISRIVYGVSFYHNELHSDDGGDENWNFIQEISNNADVKLEKYEGDLNALFSNAQEFLNAPGGFFTRI